MPRLITTTTAVKLIVDTPKYYNKFSRIQSVLNKATLPYICIVASVGLITNTATSILLSMSLITNTTRHKWTLIALALSDLLHNNALTIRIIHDINKGKIEYLCIIISFLSHLAELLSACYTVLFTIQRYRAVRYPLKTAVQKRSAPLVIIFLMFFCSLIFCFASSHANTYIDCHEELELRWFIADALFSFIIPFFLILIFNILIVRLIQQHAQSSISKQSIILRPLKRPRNNRKYFEEKGRLSEIEFDNQFNSNTAANQMRNHLNNQISSQENQALESLIPSSIITTVNPDTRSISPRTSIKSENGTQKNSSSQRGSYLSTNLELNSNPNSHTSQSIRVTRMLVLVSTCFLILNAPAHLCVIAMKIYTGMEFPMFSEHAELDHFQRSTNLTSNQMKNFVYVQTNNHSSSKNEHVAFQEMDTIDDDIAIHLFYIAIQITQWISYASYSINFFLYSFSGISFRTGLRELWRKLRH